MTPVLTTKKTIAIYICNDLYNEMQIRKIRELQSYFHKDLIVVTDAQDIRDDWILPAEQIISPDSNISLTTNLALSPPPLCCGVERSIMWLILNQDNYEYAWVMEDDVLWSNFTDFTDFLQSHRGDDTDLLHSNYGMEEHSFYDIGRWWPYKKLLPPFVTTQATFDRPFHEGHFQFYRLSSRFVSALNDWRLLNNGEWTFIEPLFANLAFRNDTTTTTNLTTKNFINNSIGYDVQMRWRPCYSVEQVYNKTSSNGGRGGLFHPVKQNALSKTCRAEQRFVLQQPRRKRYP
jgi:hypothetical protein